jgi:D-alanine-D-alanine ligase
MPRRRIALLYGGRSGEHEVSLRSAASVATALAKSCEILPVFIDKAGRWLLQSAPPPSAKGGTAIFVCPTPDDRGRLRRLSDSSVVAEPDVYFPVLHGPFGEDGTIQGLLDLIGAAYVGAGVAASGAGMDKALMKALFSAAGLPQVEYRVLFGRNESEERAALAELGLPLFVKPANLGSSVAVNKVREERELGRALDAALAYDRKLLIEAAVDAREIEVAVLGNDAPAASLPGEIVPDREFYDYDSKYSTESRTELKIPAPLDAATTGCIRELSLRAFQAIDACGFARVDFFLERHTGRVLLNEINTIPGFTSISMFPKLWEATGVSYPELVTRLVELGLARRAERDRLRTNYF